MVEFLNSLADFLRRVGDALTGHWGERLAPVLEAEIPPAPSQPDWMAPLHEYFGNWEGVSGDPPMRYYPRVEPRKLAWPVPPEIPHEGARIDWSPIAEMGRQEPLTAELKAVLGTETGEWAVIFEEEVSALVEDELGSWDPDTADWLQPAIHLEAAEFLFTTGRLRIPAAARTEFIDWALDKVLA